MFRKNGKSKGCLTRASAAHKGAIETKNKTSLLPRRCCACTFPTWIPYLEASDLDSVASTAATPTTPLSALADFSQSDLRFLQWPFRRRHSEQSRRGVGRR